MSDVTVSAYDAGRAAAEAGKERKSPYDGRSTETKDWLRGYDSVPKPEPVVLVPASESGDPDVHYLLGNRQAHSLVLAAPDSTKENRAHAEQSIAEIDARLKEMGYR